MQLTQLNRVANAFKVRNEIQTYFAKQYPTGTLERIQRNWNMFREGHWDMIRELEIKPSKE